MDDEAGRQVEAVGDDGLTGRALADGPAGRLQALGPGGAVDGTVDATAAEQLAVGRVDDGVDPLGRDVALHGLEQRRHRVDYPPVVDDEVGGTSLSSDTAWLGTAWFLFSPQCEKVTVP